MAALKAGSTVRVTLWLLRWARPERRWTRFVPFVDTGFMDVTGDRQRSELNAVTGGEALGFDADGVDAVGAVAADLSCVVDDEDQQVPLLRAAQGVGLDGAWPDSALRCVIVDGDLEAVGSGESFRRARRRATLAGSPSRLPLVATWDERRGRATERIGPVVSLRAPTGQRSRIGLPPSG